MSLTKKRGSDAPWKFGKVGCKCQEKKVELSEKVCQHIWENAKQINTNKRKEEDALYCMSQWHWPHGFEC